MNPFIFWWQSTCLFWGLVGKTMGLDRLQSDEGRKYNEEMFKRATETFPPGDGARKRRRHQDIED